MKIKKKSYLFFITLSKMSFFDEFIENYEGPYVDKYYSIMDDLSTVCSGMEVEYERDHISFRYLNQMNKLGELRLDMYIQLYFSEHQYTEIQRKVLLYITFVYFFCEYQLEIIFQEYIKNDILKLYDISEDWYEEFEKLHTENTNFVWIEDIERAYHEIAEHSNFENVLEGILGDKYVYQQNELYYRLVLMVPHINLFQYQEFSILVRLIEHLRYFFRNSLISLISEQNDGISVDNIFILVEINRFLENCFYPVSTIFMNSIHTIFGISVFYEQNRYIMDRELITN